MPYAIEMYFNEESETTLRGLWDELAGVGASLMRDSGARPHVSLAVCEGLSVPSASDVLDRFASATGTFSLTLASVGIFACAEPVVFLAPKVTAELLELHRRFFAEMDGVAGEWWPHYRPEHWVPHCTVAMGFPRESLGAVMEVCQRARLPLRCSVTEIGLVEFRPIRQLHVARLAEAGAP